MSYAIEHGVKVQSYYDFRTEVRGLYDQMRERERERNNYTLWPANKSDRVVECEDPNNPGT